MAKRAEEFDEGFRVEQQVESQENAVKTAVKSVFLFHVQRSHSKPILLEHYW